MMDEAAAKAAFDAGKAARYAGKPLEDNPHPPRSDERRWWYEGWCEGNLIQHLADSSRERGAR